MVIDASVFKVRPLEGMPTYGELLEAFIRVTDVMGTPQKVEHYTGEPVEVCSRIIAIRNAVAPYCGAQGVNL